MSSLIVDAGLIFVQTKKNLLKKQILPYLY